MVRVPRTDSNLFLQNTGLSTYVPSWVKTNPKRFPRVKLRKAGGVLKTSDIVSVFHAETRNADAKAFAALMRHLKEVDGDEHTVIMVQVENEVGVCHCSV